MADDTSDHSTERTVGEAGYRRYAGQVAFPRTPDDLRSTGRCPACLSVVDGSVCAACGLDLGNPAAARLTEISAEAAELLDRRLDLIGRIRFDSAQAEAARVAREQAAQAVAQVPASVPPAAAPGPVAPPVVPSPAAEAGAPRRSGVQVMLLIVGVSLLSIAAIFFLVYAFITFGLIARSLIIGGITVAAVLVASLLRRRGLVATAEGISAFGVVLILLDAFAIRANDFFGLERVDGVAYWGWTLVITAVGFVLWSRLSGLRVPSIAGFGAVVPGVGLVAGWIARDGDGAQPLFWAFVAAAAAALVQALASTRARRAATERVILLSLGTLSILLATGFAFAVGPRSDGLGAVALVGVAVVAALHVLLLDRRARTDAAAPDGVRSVFGGIFAAVAAVSASLTALSFALRTEQIAVLALAPVVVATAIALLLELLARRTDGALSAHAAVAAWSAAAIAGIAGAAVSVVLAIRAGGAAVGGPVDAWKIPADGWIPFSDGALFGVLGLVVALVLVAVAWAIGGTLRRRSTIVVWAAGILLVLAVPLLLALWALVTGWLLIAVAAVAALIVLRRSTAHRAPLITVAVLGAVLGWLSGWASTSTWLPATLALIAVLIALRATTSSTAVRAALLGSATAPLLIGAGAGARLLAMHLYPAPDADLVNTLRAVGIVAVILLGLSALPRGGSMTDRRTVFWIAAPVAAVTAVVSHTALALFRADDAPGLLLPEHATSLVVALFLLAALIAFGAVPWTAPARAERIAASLGIGPAVYWLVDSLVRLAGFADYVESLAPIAAALLAAAGALAISLVRPSGGARWAREAGVAVVGLPAVASALVLRLDAAWLVLLLAGVTALVLAISPDGLFSSASWRKHLGWPALGLGVAALWYRLAENGVGDLEPYLLPLTGALLAIAALIEISARRRGAAAPAAPALALAGALVTILPLAVAAASGPVARPLAVGAVSAVLLLLGSLVVRGGQPRPYLDAAALSGALGVLVVAAGRGISILAEPGDAGLELDGWLFSAVLLLAIAAFGQARERSDGSAAIRRIASQVIAVVALAAVLGLELPSFDSGELASPRAIGVLLLLCAVHVVAFALHRAPLSRAVSWVSIGLAAIAAISGFSTGALDPVESAAVPLALALLASGGIRLASVPTARSWAWLAPGTTMLLLPSLIATFVDAPLWRLVGLGVVAVGVLVGSTLLRLQAPFLISAGVVVVHAVRTFAPQIRFVYESVEWWLWLAIGGAIIVAIAAMFERSKRGVKRAAMTVRALR